MLGREGFDIGHPVLLMCSSGHAAFLVNSDCTWHFTAFSLFSVRVSSVSVQNRYKCNATEADVISAPSLLHSSAPFY